MTSPKHLRKRLFVDRSVQGALALRMVLYWITCVVTMTLVMLCWNIVTRPVDMLYSPDGGAWFHFGPALIGALLLLPIVISDIIRMSNRFAGPLVRLRRGMRDLAEGKLVEPIHFRDGDFWQDFADEFNAVAARVQQEATRMHDGGPSDAADEAPSEDELVTTRV